MEFLLRTQHPELGLTFHRFGVGGATFASAEPKLAGWLADAKPTVVFLNFGSNDANKGEAGLPDFKTVMTRFIGQIEASGARVVLMTPQAADVRKSGKAAAARRTLYSEVMLAYGKEKGWPVVDTHHPEAALQAAAQKDDDTFTINKDTIHLTEAGYVAWGLYLYQGLKLPAAESRAAVNARGKVLATSNCRVSEIQQQGGGLAFTRTDAVLPILPPAALPPYRYTPLVDVSRYLLKVQGLRPGRYEIRCEGMPLGTADDVALASGVNLNALLLESGNAAPWAALAKDVWQGKSAEKLGTTPLHYEVRPLAQ